MKIEVKTPQTTQEWAAYFNIRYVELRQPWNQPLGSEKTDNEELSHHFALFCDDKMVGVLRMDELLDNTTAQFRFMAILGDYQGKKLGDYLMNAAEEKAKSLNKNLIILHAREKAVSFYERLGFTVHEKSYLLFDAIQHFEMRKKL